MAHIARGLGARGLRVARFEFPYMAAARADGRKRPPDRASVLLESWRAAIADLGGRGLAIGGKSLGGRMASLIADDERPKGLVALGYPFHAPGRPEKLRIDHLKDLETPTLICQGTRDSMGNRDMVESLTLSPSIRFHWLEDGDHSFKPRVRSGRTELQNWNEAVEAVGAFLKSL